MGRPRSNGPWAEINAGLRESLALSSACGPVAGGRVGLECEFAVLQDGRQVDFAEVLPRLAESFVLPLRRESHRRYRYPSGHLLMADGYYAELATPPEALGPDLPARLARSLMAARNHLVRSLAALSRATGRRYEIRGYSCHFNLESPPFPPRERLARHYASTYGMLVMFLTSQPEVLGFIVRPRPGRLEIVADGVDEVPRLRACITAVLGAFLAAVDDEAGGARLDQPRLGDEAMVPATVRPGWRITFAPIDFPRRRRIRQALIPMAGGGEVRLNDLLLGTWHVIEPYLAEVVSPAERRLARAFVVGARRAPFERAARPEGSLRVVPVRGGWPPGVRWFESALRPRQLDGWRLEPAFTHWDFLVLAARNGGAACFLSLPHRLFGRYASGALDGPIEAALTAIGARGGPRGPVLASAAVATEPGLFRRVDKRALARDLEQATFSARGAKKPTPRKSPPERRVCEVRATDQGIEICVPRTMDPLETLQPQEPPQNETVVGHGVWVHNGAFGHRETDHQVRGLGFDFAFVRNYRSSIEYDGTLGLNWDHAYDIRAVPEIPAGPPAGGGEDVWCELFAPGRRGVGLTYYHGTGRMTRHAFAGWEIRSVRWCEGAFAAVVTTYAQNPGESFEIERYAVLPGSTPPPPIREPIFYRIRFRGGVRYLLNCHGYVVEIRHRNHNRMAFEYGLPPNPKTNYLVLRRIRDTLGREYRLDYKVAQNGMPRIIHLVEVGGKQRRVSFTYNGDDTLLAGVKLPRGDAGLPEIAYGYVPGGRAGLLRTIVNPVEAASAPDRHWLENTYQGPLGNERVVRQRVGAPPGSQPPAGGEFQLDYGQPGRVVVTARDRVRWTYVVPADVVREIHVEDDVFEGGQVVARPLVTKLEYDASYHVITRELPSGLVERFRYRSRNRPIRAGEERDKAPLFTHLNDLARDDLLTYAIEPAGFGAGFTTTYRYERLFNSVTRIDAPTGRTTFRYDHGQCAWPERNGNPIRVVHPSQDLPRGGPRRVVELYEYGPGGRVIYHRDPDGVEHDFDLHETGQVAFHYIGGRLHEWFDYDPVGNPERRQDARGSEWTMRYDDRDNLRRLIDPMGHTTEYTYDLNDRPKTKTLTMADDPTGIAGIPPSPVRTLLEETSYDILGHLREAKQTVSPAGAVKTWRWEYDPEERPTAALSPRAAANERPDARTGFKYNARGLLRERTLGDQGPNASITRFAYDRDGRLALTTDPSRGEHVTAYDGFGRPVRDTGPDGTVVHREYDGVFLWREWVEGPISRGPAPAPAIRVLRESHFRFDRHGRVIVRRDLVFDPATRPSVTPVSTSATYQRLFSTQYAGQPAAVTRTWFTPGGRVERLEAPAGGITTRRYRFDDWGQLDRVDLPGGHRVDFEYDGTLVRVKRTTLKPEAGTELDPSPTDLVLEETRDYDPLGRVIKTTSAHRLATEYAYDSLGNRRAEKAPLGLKTYQFDGFSRLVRMEIHRTGSPSNLKGRIVLAHGYDLNDNAISSRDDLGRETAATFDGRDLTATIRQPGRAEVTLTRRADGLVRRAAMGAGREATFEYDAVGRLRHVDAREGTTHCRQAFGYDGLGRVTWAFDSNSAPQSDRVQVYRTYDSLGRLASERIVIPEHGFDKTVRYAFGADHRERTIHYPEDNPTLDYRFGLDGTLAGLHRNGERLLTRLSQGPGRPLETRYRLLLDVARPQPRTYAFDFIEAHRYDDVGRPDWRTLALRDVLVPGGGFVHVASGESIVYDLAHGLIARRHIGALRGVPQAVAAASIRFRYDGAGRVFLSRWDVGPDGQLFEYDWDGGNSLHGLVEVRTRAGTTSQRETTVMYPNAPDHRNRTERAPDGETEWRFDGEGRVSYTEHRPRAGGGARDAFREFTYDPLDRLVRVFAARIPLDYIEGTEIGYLYDAFGRLGLRTSSKARGLPDDFRLFFVWDGPRPIAEYGRTLRRNITYVYDDSGQLVHYRARTETEIRDFVPVTTMDGSPWFVLRARTTLQELPRRAGTTQLARRRYYAENIPFLAEEQRSLPFEENPIVRFDYSGGALDVTPARQPLIPLATGGRRYFEQEQLVYNLHRFYDPALRGFLTPDGTGVWGDPAGLGNPYAYAGNNPVSLRDDGAGPIAVLAAALTFGFAAGAVNLGRQSIQILQDRREAFDLDELAEWTIAGAAMGAGLVCLPPAITKVATGILLAAGGAQIIDDLRHLKQVGWGTAAYDAAMLAFPLALPRLRAGAIRLQARYYLWRLERNPN